MRRVMTAMAAIGIAAATAGGQQAAVASPLGAAPVGPRVQLWVVDEETGGDVSDDARDPSDRYDSRPVGAHPLVRVRLSEPGYLTLMTVDRSGTVRTLHPGSAAATRQGGSAPFTFRLADGVDDDASEGWGYVVAFASAQPPRYEYFVRDQRWRTLRVAPPDRTDPSDAVEALARELYPDGRADWDADFAFVSDLGGRQTTAWRSPYLAECADAASRWAYSPWGLWSSRDAWCQRYAHWMYGPSFYGWGWANSGWANRGTRWHQQPVAPPPAVTPAPVGDGRDMAVRDARRGLRPAGPPLTPVDPVLPEQRQRDEPWGRGTVPTPVDRGSPRPAERDSRWESRRDELPSARPAPADKVREKPARDAAGARRTSQATRVRAVERPAPQRSAEPQRRAEPRRAIIATPRRTSTSKVRPRA